MASATILLVRWAEGWLDVPSPTATGRRKEATLAAGNIKSVSETVDAARQVLDHLQGPQESIVAGIEPYDDEALQPYVGWRPLPNTFITVPGWDGTPDAQKVAAMTVRQDNSSGNVTYTPELIDQYADREARQQRWLKRMSAGAIGGATAQSSPEKPQWNPKIPQRKPTAVFTQGNVDEDGNPGPVFVARTPDLPAEVLGELREWFTYVTTAGSTATISDLILDGVVVGTAVIPPGELDGWARLSGLPITPNRSRLACQVTQAGFGATGFGGQARVDAITT